MMHQLIVTADDYGMSRGVNQAINEGIACGLITSTNVMVNMPLYQESESLRQRENCSIGLHWTLTCGNPVLPPNQVKTLVDSEGRFYSYPEFRQRFRKHMIDEEDISKELKAQYELFHELIGTPDYWNTHQNFHVDFGIYAMVVDLAVKLGIHRMRSHQRIYVPSSGDQEKISLAWRMVEPVKARMLDTWQNNAHKKGVKSPEGLIVNIGKQDIDHPEYLFSHIQWNKKKIGEYVIHPATVNDSPFFGKIVEQRIREYRMFTSSELYNIFQQAEIELVGYDRI